MRRFGLIALTIIALALAGCQSLLAQSTAQAGDLVRVDYTLTLSDGTVADSSEGRGPLEFTLGAGEVVPGFDNGVTGLGVGESTEFLVPAADGYGEPQPDLILELPRQEEQEGQELTVDTPIFLSGPGGLPIPARVLEIKEETIVVDANHPLAGEDLNFAVTLVEIVDDTGSEDATSEEALEP